MILNLALGSLTGAAIVAASALASYGGRRATPIRTGFVIAVFFLITASAFISYPSAALWALAAIGGLEAAAVGLIFWLSSHFYTRLDCRSVKGSISKR
jgi:hypothetical protein